MGEDQMQITTVSIDIAKNVFHVIGCNASNKIMKKKAVVSRAKGKTDALSQWINRLVATRGHNKACVAYANKMARIAWAVTVSGEVYQAR
jgi:hypothetical protein